MEIKVSNNFPRNNEEQKELIESFSTYSELFHECNFNNYTLNFINRNLDIDSLIKNKSSALRKLNVANYNLLLFCKICAEELQSTISVKNGLKEKCDGWLNIIRSGNSFHTLSYAQTIIDTLNRHDFPFIDNLFSKKYVVIKNAFVGLESKYKSLYKLCIYLNEKHLYDVLERIFNILQEDTQSFHFVERVEVAKMQFELSGLSSFNVFPLISLTVHNDKNEFAKDLSDFPLINKLRKLIQDLKPVNMNSDMAIRIGNHMNLYQGYRNYKNFLRLINSLDEVYDPQYQYALIRK
ncbi:hypothetical protein [Flagellimonas meridianipacifica]|uniref:Uncharacterized protein n=1 Tax=Flagellimonas meridianipacifica TaxID=1080225 RepID=A0A2T0MFN1_9FLAO|nr:hypothetical protein [Allomuricauda pacifica]PRX56388.1 hypothetical protein CLV81_0385 [Allomuricauda pacifica]